MDGNGDVIAVAAPRRLGGTVPSEVAVQVTKVIAGLAAEHQAGRATPPVALGLLEEIVVEADVAMTRLATGEAVNGRTALHKIRDMARDALRLAGEERAS